MTYVAPKSARRTAIAAIAILAGITGLATPAANAASQARTNVSIQAQVGGFFGYVSSSNHNCELNRTVKLYKQGSSRVIGSDLAQPNGPDSQWSINPGLSGRFYVKVAATSRCSAATSRVVLAQN